MAQPLRFHGLERIKLLGLELPVATTRSSRLLGLALLPRERAGPGLLIPRCRALHTLGMRFALDLLFFDRRRHVIEIRRDVPPGRFVRCSRAMAVLELPSPSDLDGRAVQGAGGAAMLAMPRDKAGIAAGVLAMVRVIAGAVALVVGSAVFQGIQNVLAGAAPRRCGRGLASALGAPCPPARAPPAAPLAGGGESGVRRA